MTDTEQFLQQSQHEAQVLAKDIAIKTGFKIDADDPAIVSLIAQRRWLESLFERKLNQNNRTALAVFSNLEPMLKEMKILSENMKATEKAIAEKVSHLQNETKVLNAFRDEMVVYFTAKAQQEVQPFVAETVKNEISGSLNNINQTLSGCLNTFKLKSNLILGFVLILQNLFILEFLMGNEAKQQELKTRLGILFEESQDDE